MIDGATGAVETDGNGDRRRSRRIDRADHIRADPDALSALMGDRALVLRMEGCDPVVTDEGLLLWDMLDDASSGAELLFLGLDSDRACFAAVPRSHTADELRGKVWQRAGLLNPQDFATFSAARSLANWHATHRYCSRCGSMTVQGKGGWQRDCTDSACGASHFPRTDPVAIMTVEHVTKDGERLVLLGRGLGWPEGMYSALAGFIEPGETIEQAVQREVLEEAGLKVHSVRYRFSQAWPFPSQLMIGCHAITDHPALAIDRTELADAFWATRAEVFAAMENLPGKTFEPPPRHAIAYNLLRDWLDRLAA